MLFSGLTLIFLREFWIGLELALPLLLSLAIIVTLLGQFVGKKESWTPFESFYWAFITATTVGYGDLRPVKSHSRIIAILIGFLGLILSGIVIAIAVQAGTLALKAVRGSTQML
jgi:voltage-gated potassium channel